MKVIGKGYNGSFILEANETEVANLLGYAWMRQVSDKLPTNMHYRRDNPVQVGDDIQVAKMYQSLTELAKLESKLQQARAILTTVAGGLTMVDPIVREVNAAIEPKTEGS